MATNAKKFMKRMRAGDPELQEEYERLGPRYAAIDALIRARKRAKLSQAVSARVGPSLFTPGLRSRRRCAFGKRFLLPR